MFWKPASPIGVSAASLPPVTITSASPCWMARSAHPIELPALAQAVATAKFGPLMPYMLETWPLAELTISFGIVKGETFSIPLVSRRSCCDSNSDRPPMPEPITTPQR